MKIHGSLLKERKRSLLTDKSNKKISIIGIGESDMDLFLKVDRMPGRGEKVRAKEIGKLPGGIIGNFCSQAVKMGVSCGIVTDVGKDDYGRFLKEDYKNRGIDITGLYEDEKENTFYCVVFLDGSGEKYLSAVVSPLTSPDIRRIDYDYVRQAEYVHICSMDHALAERTAQELAGSGTKLSLDYEVHAEKPGIDNWEHIFSRVSVLFTNEEGIYSLFPTENMETAARYLLSLGIETVVVTCAQKGGCVYQRGDSFHYEAFHPDEIRDTTGAGDSFNGTFLACMAKGMTARWAAEYGAAAASFVIQKEGARTGQTDIKEIEAFLKGKFQEQG